LIRKQLEQLEQFEHLEQSEAFSLFHIPASCLKLLRLQPKVTIGLVLFGSSYLTESLPSLLAQDYPNLEFIFRDHSPSGATKKFIEENLPEVAAKAQIEVGENLFHSGGMNALINASTGKYFVAASTDMLYSPDLISKAIAKLEKPENKQFGFAAPKLRKWDAAWNEKTRFLDSVGIGITYSHHFYDIGSGEMDNGQFDNLQEVFGASGALVIFRREALDDIALKREYFEEYLHFKNDVEISYRLQWAGWKCLPLKDCIAWHSRGLSREKQREKRSKLEIENSFFGHRATILKNFSPDFSLRTKVTTHLRNFFTLIYSAIFETSSLLQLRKLRELKPTLIARGRLSPHRIAASEIEKYMG
jgi:GT2 family glycosyltransferase